MSVLATLMRPYVAHVRRSVNGSGGSVSYAFSQCLEPVAGIIGTNKTTADGVCELLSARWIIEHAHGRSLKSWLGGEHIDASKIRLLMQLFILGDSYDPEMVIDPAARGRGTLYGTGAQQTKSTINYLMTQGLVRSTGQGRAEAWREGQYGGGEKIKHGLARAICEEPGDYRTIGVWGRVGGHAMAAYAGLNSVMYFDPNFGEFSFNSHDRFTNWFVNEYYPSSFYTKFLGNSYEVYRFKKR